MDAMNAAPSRERETSMHGRTRITKRSETRRLSYVDAFADEPWRPVDGSDMETLLTFEPVVHASNAAVSSRVKPRPK